ncbi:MAG TPA: toll/interleukin-1 receptor domain-containing protein [Nitrospiraceae bacterium]|nr:toll/interleukin-1 receptor domain-containing protein [Nitrospiraceae bacterium]
MITIAGKWVGTIQGTNSGAVLAEFMVTNERLSGVVHINDPIRGVGVYAVNGEQETPDDIRLVLTPNRQTHMIGHGIVTVLAHMVSPTQFSGDWRSSVGTNGTLSITKVAVEPIGFEQPSQGSTVVSKRTKVFISYSHEDIAWLERLRVHLKPLERDYALDIWDDRKIQAGSKWLEEIERAIQAAKVALLIISADFLASDFITNSELPPLLDAAKRNGAVIMPLIVSPSRFRSTTSLFQFQAVNDPSRPLITMTKGEQEEILVKLSEDIETILKPLL